MKKTPGKIIISHMCTINSNHMMMVTEILSMTDRIFLSFWTIFCPFTPLTTQKIKILKKWKELEILSFYTCIPKIIITWCTVPEIWCMRYRRTDGRKWYIEVDAPPKNSLPFKKILLAKNLECEIFHMNTNTRIDFQICISVPLRSGSQLPKILVLFSSMEAF